MPLDPSLGLADLLDRLCLPRAALDEAVGAALATRGGARSQAGSLNCERLEIGVASGTAGIWRLSGDATDGQPWSLMVKGLWNEPGTHDQLWATTSGSAHEPFHWGREANAYPALLLERPARGGLRTPAFCGLLSSSEGLSARRVGVLMEELTGVSGTLLTLADFRAVASALGATQGRFLLDILEGRFVPPSWLALGYAPEFVGRVAKMTGDPDDVRAWSNPALRPFLQRPVNDVRLRDALQSVWEARQDHLAILARLPCTLAHNDLWPGQLVQDPAGIVVYDLATLGLSPMGQDLGKLASEVIAANLLPANQFASFERALLGGYLEGLAVSGIDTSLLLVTQLVLLGWSASVAAMESYKLTADWLPLAAGDERAQVITKQWGGRSMPTMFRFYADQSRRLLYHAELSRQLALELESALAAGVTLADLATPRRLRNAHA